MSNDVLKEIRSAEEKAESIRRDAAALARQMRESTLRGAEEKFAAAAESIEKEKRAALETVRAQADAIIAEAMEDGRQEAEAIRRAAGKKKAEAVKLIFGEIYNKCPPV